MSLESKANDLQELFGSFRAEWLRDQLYSLFNEPEYFPSLRDRRPCALMGGRGTGKTTVLRCMSFEGQAAIHGGADDAVAFIGLYHKVNSNRVTAFQGPELDDLEWQRIFSHYVNLLVGELIFDYIAWRNAKADRQLVMPAASCQRIGRAFGFANTESLEHLGEQLNEAKQMLELFVNNLDTPRPTLSMLQAPIDTLTEELLKLPELRHSFFYILFDEYENFLDYQQTVVNTLIKHSGTSYVFKIGVKELGWRVKSTINGTEQLIAPADYELIHIEKRLEPNFSTFARDVCEARLRQWASSTNSPHLSLDDLLPELPYEQEAELLGVKDRVRDIRARIMSDKDAVLAGDADDLLIYVFHTLNGGIYEETLRSVEAYLSGNSYQKDRYNNYKYAMLFTLTTKGAQISKYYCGNRVFSTIAKNNIRFYLHLVSTAIDRHRSSKNSLEKPVSFVDQTLAARAVGLQYLTELEGVTVQGVQLVKLILGFGRLFQLLSRNPTGTAPETMEFSIKQKGQSSAGVSANVAQLLTHAVMHLALVRSPGTKLATQADIKQWDYSLHPIFSPYFNFSHRRKRKLEVTEHELLSMIDAPQETIRALLKGKAHLIDEEPPAQLKLFDDYYAGAM